MLKEGVNVRGDEVALRGKAQHQWRSFPGTEDRVGPMGGDHAKCEGPFEPLDGRQEGGFHIRRFRIGQGDQVRQHLRVGL